jgi:hypothetical protein
MEYQLPRMAGPVFDLGHINVLLGTILFHIDIFRVVGGKTGINIAAEMKPKLARLKLVIVVC